MGVVVHALSYMERIVHVTKLNYKRNKLTLIQDIKGVQAKMEQRLREYSIVNIMRGPCPLSLETAVFHVISTHLLVMNLIRGDQLMNGVPIEKTL